MELLFKMVICDDDINFLDIIYKKVVDIVRLCNCKCEITKLYNSEELINYCKSNPVDIIFTDIDMPDLLRKDESRIPNMDGFEAAKYIQSENSKAEIFFISAHEEFAYQAYRYRPFSFISKRDVSMLDDELSELLKKLIKQRTENSLFHLTVGKKSYVINTDEIMYFKSDKHYIWAYNVIGRDKSYRLRMNEAYEQLKKANFIFVHRSYLINCKFIKYFDTKIIVLSNDYEISVTRNGERWSEAKNIFGDYKRGLR